MFAVSPHPAVITATMAQAPTTSAVRITKLTLKTPPNHRSTGSPGQRYRGCTTNGLPRISSSTVVR
jgi:hypothetical protein